MNRARSAALKAVGLCVAATVIGLFFATQSYLAYLYRDGQANFKASMSVTLPDWYVWTLFAPLIIWLARKFPLERQSWPRSLPLHLGIGILITLAKLFCVVLLTKSISWLPSRPVSIAQFHPNYLTYWVIVGLSHAFDYYRKFRERELRTSQLQTLLAQSQLQMLKMQLQPHFLFNTLHAISALMHRDVEAADRMMARLSDLLRLTLENVGIQEVSLKQELEFLDGYLEIETTRFQDRLSIEKHIDPETLDARIPNLILQPLVENAVRHGIEPRSGPGRIEIRAQRLDGNLQIKIRDDGPGMASSQDSGRKEGVGLKNTRARLQQLYGENFRFEIMNSASAGVEVLLAIPFRTKQSSMVE